MQTYSRRPVDRCAKQTIRRPQPVTEPSIPTVSASGKTDSKTSSSLRAVPALDLVPLPEKPIEPYAEIVGNDVVEEIAELAAQIDGARVLHLNPTAFGGGVAELLYALVPLMRSVGLDAEWRLIHGSDEFFNVTKAAHNGLQGMEVLWTSEMESIYIAKLRENIESWADNYDFVVCHDPQTAALLRLLTEVHGERPNGKWIWRCHIDTTAPHEPVSEFFKPFINEYDAGVFTLDDYVPQGFEPQIAIIPPCIDPLAHKNLWMDKRTVRAMLQAYQIDIERPIACQISRFDPWKDPLGVIDAYRLAKEEVPGLQLIMAGSMATDDPEGWHYFTATDEHREGDPDIYLLTNMQQVGATQVNAFQRASDIVLQKSIREGFALTVAEALWKETPVIGGRAGGIRLQILEGETGFLVDSVEECATRMVELLKNPEEAIQMGKQGKEHIRKNYLSTNNLKNYLELFVSLNE